MTWLELSGYESSICETISFRKGRADHQRRNPPLFPCRDRHRRTWSKASRYEPDCRWLAQPAEAFVAELDEQQNATLRPEVGGPQQRDDWTGPTLRQEGRHDRAGIFHTDRAPAASSSSHAPEILEAAVSNGVDQMASPVDSQNRVKVSIATPESARKIEQGLPHGASGDPGLLVESGKEGIMKSLPSATAGVRGEWMVAAGQIEHVGMVCCFNEDSLEEILASEIVPQHWNPGAEEASVGRKISEFRPLHHLESVLRVEKPVVGPPAAGGVLVLDRQDRSHRLDDRTRIDEAIAQSQNQKRNSWGNPSAIQRTLEMLLKSEFSTGFDRSGAHQIFGMPTRFPPIESGDGEHRSPWSANGDLQKRPD